MACQQFETDWCWATCVAGVASFYKDESQYAQCKGLECKIIGFCPKPNGDMSGCSAPQECCGTESCAKDSGTLPMIAISASNFSGVPHAHTGALSQDQLDAALAHGPIIQVVGIRVISHALIIGGCAGGMYYRHDPEKAFGDWELLTYQKLLKSSAFKPRFDVNWLATVLPTSSVAAAD